jgi:hypothetical protein
MYLHKQMKTALKKVKTDRDIGNLDPALLMAAYDVVENPPQHKWNGKRPVLAVFVDDSQSTALFRSAKFLNLCIRHRHVGSSEKTGMGVSMFICVQNYTAQHGGIPKAIRDNVSTMMLYKTRSSNVLKTIMEDISDQITDEEFFSVYQQACQDEHDFLFIDWAPKKHRFRRCFDQYLPVSSDAKINGDKSRRSGADHPSERTGEDSKQEGPHSRSMASKISRGSTT